MSGSNGNIVCSRCQVYPPAPACTHLHSPASACTHLYPPAPTCTRLHMPVPSCTHLHLPALTCTLLHVPAPTCTHLHTPAPSCNLPYPPASACIPGLFPLLIHSELSHSDLRPTHPLGLDPTPSGHLTDVSQQAPTLSWMVSPPFPGHLALIKALAWPQSQRALAAAHLTSKTQVYLLLHLTLSDSLLNSLRSLLSPRPFLSRSP